MYGVVLGPKCDNLIEGERKKERKKKGKGTIEKWSASSTLEHAASSRQEYERAEIALPWRSCMLIDGISKLVFLFGPCKPPMNRNLYVLRSAIMFPDVIVAVLVVSRLTAYQVAYILADDWF